jgi:hypothetical protein
MKKGLIVAAVGFLFLALAAPHEAAACSKCGYGGSMCGLDGCVDVWVCRNVTFGKNGYNDCTPASDGCDFGDNSFCMWASNISPVEKPQFWAPVCHEKNS